MSDRQILKFLHCEFIFQPQTTNMFLFVLQDKCIANSIQFKNCCFPQHRLHFFWCVILPFFLER